MSPRWRAIAWAEPLDRRTVGTPGGREWDVVLGSGLRGRPLSPARPPAFLGPPRLLAGVVGLAVLGRLWLAAWAPGPGIADPTYYFDLAPGLAEGRGFYSPPTST